MRLEYSTQISPFPISLSIGTIRKPKLRDIFSTESGMSFEKLKEYEAYLGMTPEIYLTKVKENDGGKEAWDSFTDEKKQSITMYELLTEDEQLRNMYLDIFKFFFIEDVAFYKNMFILADSKDDGFDYENLKGAILAETFNEVLSIIRQICCIGNEKKDAKKPLFKNGLARKLYERMQKSEANSKKGNQDINLTIPNIISAVSAMHPSLNYTNIWDLTLFQLLDSFSRLQTNSVYQINSTRVSVWGDDKKEFDDSLWYKNRFDL